MKKIFIPSLLTAIVLGLIFPYGTTLKGYIPYILGILLFFNFYSIEFEIKDFLKIELLIHGAIMLILMPAVVYFLSKPLIEPLRIGLFIIAISPPAIISTITVRFLKGDAKYSVISTVLFNLLSPVTYTVLTSLYFQSSHISVSPWHILIKLLLLIFIPFFASQILKKSKKLTPILLSISKPASYLFLITVYTGVSYSAEKIKNLPVNELILIILFTVLIAIIYYTAGILFGQSRELKKTLAVSMGQKNTALCIWVGLANFDPLSVIPATLYVLIHHSINTILLFWFNKNETSDARET